MSIKNSDELIKTFLSTFDFSSVYTEENFPLQYESNLSLPPAKAIEYLVSAASVGNKTLGFFNKIPKISLSSNIRGICMLITTTLPDELVLPTFFCKTTEDLTLIMPHAVKAAVDGNVPILIVLSANALHNYRTGEKPSQEYTAIRMDRNAPYIGKPTSPYEIAFALENKLVSSFNSLQQILPQGELTNEISFELTDKSFPKYLFPIKTEEQSQLFKNIDTINTTEKEYPFIKNIVDVTLFKAVKLAATLQSPKALSKTLLCPGCPFATLFNNSFFDKNKECTLFTSVHCPAIMDVYPAQYSSYEDYLGKIHSPLNVSTIFVGNISNMLPINADLLKNGRAVALQDDKDRSPFPTSMKYNSLKNSTFPYSCNNIKKSSPMKVKIKRCKCVKNGSEPQCIKNARCAAILRKSDVVFIDTNMCVGCGRCIQHCPERAIS